jgi:hypothetical protein
VELTERERQLRDDYDWILHDAEVQRSQAGKVVAVYRHRIVGAGKDHREAIQEALHRPDCPPREEIALVFVEGRTLPA